jgi:hypothetical protein
MLLYYLRSGDLWAHAAVDHILTGATLWFRAFQQELAEFLENIPFAPVFLNVLIFRQECLIFMFLH